MKNQIHAPRRQGRLLAFGLTGAMAMAVSGCNQSNQTMIAPPNGFNPNKAAYYGNTNQPPTNSSLYSGSGCGGYLGARGYYPVYGYPNYYYRPVPGSTVELVTGGSSSYRASSPAEANASVARGGFGAHGGGEGGGE